MKTAPRSEQAGAQGYQIGLRSGSMLVDALSVSSYHLELISLGSVDLKCPGYLPGSGGIGSSRGISKKCEGGPCGHIL